MTKTNIFLGFLGLAFMTFLMVVLPTFTDKKVCETVKAWRAEGTVACNSHGFIRINNKFVAGDCAAFYSVSSGAIDYYTNKIVGKPSCAVSDLVIRINDVRGGRYETTVLEGGTKFSSSRNADYIDSNYVRVNCPGE